MQRLDVRGEAALQDDIVVELIPVAQRSEPGAGEAGQRAEQKTCDGEIAHVGRESNCQSNEQGWRWIGHGMDGRRGSVRP